MDGILENLGVLDVDEGSGWRPATTDGVIADQCKGVTDTVQSFSTSAPIDVETTPTTKPITLVLANLPTINDGKSYYTPTGDFYTAPTSKPASEPIIETPPPTSLELTIIANGEVSGENQISHSPNSQPLHLGLVVALFGSWLSVLL